MAELGKLRFENNVITDSFNVIEGDGDNQLYGFMYDIKLDSVLVHRVDFGNRIEMTHNGVLVIYNCEGTDPSYGGYVSMVLTTNDYRSIRAIMVPVVWDEQLCRYIKIQEV